jgi:hypothetical protein
LIEEIQAENSDSEVKESKDEIESRLKLKTIKDIQNEGLEVIHIIHRWNMTSDEAFLVEAAVIDCFAGLSNKQNGHDFDHGVINAQTLQKNESVSEFIEPDNIEDFMIIKIRQDILDRAENRYEVTRCCWRISLEQAKKRKYVLSATDGIVQAIYKVTQWRYVLPQETTYPSDMGRVVFEGEEIKSGEIYTTFHNKRLPEKYCKKGMASPCLYCKK